MEPFVQQLEQLLVSAQHDKAREIVRALQQTDPARYELGMAVIATYEREPSAAEHAQRAYYSAPDEPIVLEYLAVATMIKGDAAGAEFHARKAATRDPSLRRLGALGNILLGAGKFADANRTYRSMLERDPVNPQALNGVATTLYKLGDNENALLHFARAFDADPQDLKPIESIANMCIEAGRLLGAISFAQIVRDKIEGDGPAKLALDLTIVELTRSLTTNFPPPVVAKFADEAVSHLVATASPRGAGVKLAVVRELLECNRLDEASTLVAQLAKQTLGDVERGDLHFLTGRIAELKGDRKTALESYRSCIEITPAHWRACCNATSILLERGDGESLAEIRLLLQRVPADARTANPPILINEALYLKRVGRNADARKCLEQVLQITKGQGSLGQIATQVLQDLR